MSETANSIVDALKSQPLTLALVLMNLGLLGYLYYEGMQAAKQRQQELELLYQNRHEVAELLFKCQPPSH